MENMNWFQQFIVYFQENGAYVFSQFIRHFLISIYGVLFAAVIGIPIGIMVSRKLPETITLNSWDFCLQLAEKGKVACIPGSAFGPEGEGFIRISYASSMAQLEEACRRIRTFLGK